MKKLIVINLILLSICIDIYAQSEIFRKNMKSEKWTSVGRCENGLVYYKQRKDNLNLVGKFDNGLIYHKLAGKNKWRVVGKCEEGFIYEKLRNDRWEIIGKYEAGMIFKKSSGKSKWINIGKYDTCYGEAAYLLLFMNNDDNGSVVLIL